MTDEAVTTTEVPVATEGTAIEGTATEPPRRSKSRGVALFLRDILFILLAAIVISFLIKTFLIRSFYIPSASMEETLHVNDRVIVSLLTPGVTPLKHGDVVVFTDPGGWLTDEESSRAVAILRSPTSSPSSGSSPPTTTTISSSA